MSDLQSFSDSSLERVYAPFVNDSNTQALLDLIRGDVLQTARLNLVVGRLALDELNRRGVDVHL